ncbi:MAG: MFS transporter [Flavobacteriaceae bacterium]|nr:MFS transporter [Flavobacteriaceae bacterium]
MNTKDSTIAFTMFLAGVCCYGLLYYYQPLLPLLAKEFGLTATQSSFAVSFSTLGMTVGLLIGMFFSDRVGRKKLFSTTLLLGAIFALLSSFSTSFLGLVTACFLKGICLAGTASVSLAYINEEVSETNKSRVTGLYIAGGAFGGMSARVGASYLGSVFSWFWASILVALLGIFLTVLIFWKSPYSTKFTPQKKTFKMLFVDNLNLLTNKYLLAYCCVGAMLIVIFVSLYNYISFVLLRPPFELPQIYISNIYFLFIFGLFGSVITHRLLRFLSPIRLLQILLFTTFVGLVFLLFNSLFFIILGLIIVTMCFFMSHICCSYKVSNFSTSHRSVAISIYLLMYYTFSSVLGSLSGTLLDYGSWSIFVAVLLGVVFLLLIITVWIRKREHNL